MSYMYCPRCGLSVRLRFPNLAPEHCPRCLARRETATEMQFSDLPGGPGASCTDVGAPDRSAADLPPCREPGSRSPH